MEKSESANTIKLAGIDIGNFKRSPDFPKLFVKPLHFLSPKVNYVGRYIFRHNIGIHSLMMNNRTVFNELTYLSDCSEENQRHNHIEPSHISRFG